MSPTPTPVPTPSISAIEELLDTILDILNPTKFKTALNYIADLIAFFAFVFALVDPSGTFTKNEKGWVTIGALTLLVALTIVRLYISGKLKSVLSSVFVSAAAIHADNTTLVPAWSAIHNQDLQRELVEMIKSNTKLAAAPDQVPVPAAPVAS